MGKLFSDLKARGLVYQATHEDLDDVLANKRTSVYCGFDPSAPSLHVGSLVPITALMRFQRDGHRPIVLMGGGTGMIGDPSGRDTERQLLDVSAIEENVASQRKQIERFLDPSAGEASVLFLNNAEWLTTVSFVDFMREVGKHFSVNMMLAKESVKNRLEAGMSFTEFSYMLLQGYDFLYLFDHHNCTFQIGGQDQWGNITAGMDLIRRVRGQQAYGITLPLITASSGRKFSKSEGDTIWLDEDLTSPYELYQYYINIVDSDVVNCLRYYTFLELSEIEAYAELVKREPEKRETQKRLAFELTRMVHGEDAARLAERASQILFGEKIRDLTDKIIEDVFKDVPTTSHKRKLLDDGLNVVDALVSCKAVSSKGEARRLLKSGGVYVNNERTDDQDTKLSSGHLASPHFIVLRTGKKKYFLMRFA
jgi:tyrosyl-tRNA synthetase